MFVLIANIILAIRPLSRVWDARLTKKDGAVSNVLLLVFGMNMVLYVTYYMIMKNYYALVCRRTSPEKDASACCDQTEKDPNESVPRSYVEKGENSPGDKKEKESNEKMTWYCWLYLVLAFISISSSLHFFVHLIFSSWDTTDILRTPSFQTTS